MKLMKKIFLAMMLILLMLVITPNTVNAAKVKISSTKKTMYKGYTYTLKITGTKKKITWTSSDKNIATVNSKGKVYTKKNGKTKITAKIGGKKYTCKVTVKNKPYKLTQFSTTFYDLKDVAKVYKDIGKINNYAEYKYDLDGDGKKDKITIKRVEKKVYNDDNTEDYDETYYYTYLNGKKFGEDLIYGEALKICIVDLNKNDKKLDIIIDTWNNGSKIYQKIGNKMKKISDFYFYEDMGFIKVNQKGKILTRSLIEKSFSPYIVGSYFELSNKGKLKSINTNVNNISKITCKITDTDSWFGSIYFTTNKKNIKLDKDYKTVKKGTKFKILKNEIYFNHYEVIKVKLSNGKIGYLFTPTAY
mgnify:CR=1 FL=1